MAPRRGNLPALPDAPDAQGADAAAVLAQVRNTIALIGVADLADLATDTKRLAVLATAAGRVKVGADAELDWSEAARTAERRLGQLLVEGREAGVVASTSPGPGGNPLHVKGLADFGIDYNLAADAVALAELTDDQWAELLAACRELGSLARRSAAGAARARIEKAERAASEAQSAADRLAEAEAERVAAAERLEQLLAAAPPAPDLPPEPDYSVAFLADPDEPDAPGDTGPPALGPTIDEIKAQHKAIEELNALARQLEAVAARQVVAAPWWTEGHVMAVRSAMGRVVAAAHTITAAYNDLLDQPNLRSVT